MRPRSAETSEPACTKRKMLSMKRRTSWPSSRKYSAMVRPARPTRRRAPGGSFIWPKTSAVFSMTPDSVISQPEVVALARALAHAGEDREAPVLGGDVADQLLDEHGLADAGAAEEADLAALHVRGEQVDDLDAGLEDLDRRLELLEGRRGRGGSASARPRRRRPRRSAAPSTLKIRPSVAWPTGTEIGAPVSSTSAPRGRPSVESIATARTRSFPRCCWTSAIRSTAGRPSCSGTWMRRAL